MVASNQITPGMTLSIGKKLYKVESAVKVTVPKGAPFIKTKLRALGTGKVTEKNFKLDMEVSDVSLEEKELEYLYVEGKEHVFLDFKSLDQYRVPTSVVGDKINYLKEGTVVNASFYGDTVTAVELPQFLELMISQTEGDEDEAPLSNADRIAILETGARVEVPPFIETGDIIKVDTKSNEYVQRV